MNEHAVTAVASPHTIGRRYVLHERLGAGGMGTVYRATDRLTRQQVALKQLTVPTEQLAFTSRAGDTDPSLSLAREFRTLSSLRHPNIISVLDYGFDQAGQPFFTMSLLENAQTITQAGQGRGLVAQVDFLVQVLQALAYLHRRNVLHRDLKPENMLVVDDQVKLLDFGMSVVTSRTMEYMAQTIQGTLAYMAPEHFEDQPVTRATDLYAVGVIAYELFAGRHPFNTSQVSALLKDILLTPADVSSVGLNAELKELLERLLAKSKQERPDDATQVIRDLCAAAGRPEPLETVEIRESYLQAARFVGRERERERLSQALDAALVGQGSAWLVGGESGVGKSRLAEELRSLALVRGVSVLQGQAVREGGGPYYLWREALRRLALVIDLQEQEASDLKALVPDIEDLLGRDVADAPSLDPRTMQRRLWQVIADILGRECTSQAVLITLEDLQWIRSDSLALLRWLGAIIVDLPVLILGNYRDDERPDLPDDLAGMQVLKLERLDEAEIADLSESMVGPSGCEPQVVELLQRETEGNPFFLVEVVRALAANAGSLEGISRASLPERVFADGVHQVVQRRLSRVPPRTRPLLEMAAVAGRELDLEVLRRLAGGADLQQWLVACADVAVLEAQGERWRFSHDRLREGVLAEMSSDARPGVHRRVAEAIESVYPGAPEQVATLAHLWGIARDEDKERQYAARAGEQAVLHSANVEAVGHFRRALEMLAALPDTRERSRQELDTLIALGVPLTLTKGHQSSEVEQIYLRAQELCEQLGDSAQQFKILVGLRRVYFTRGKLRAAHELGEQLLGVAQILQEPTRLSFAHVMLGETACWLGECTQARSYCEEAMTLYDPEQHRSYVSRYGHDPGVASRILLALALWHLGHPDRARQSCHEGLKLARELAHPYSLVFALYFGAVFYQLLRETKLVQEHAEEVIALSTEQGFALYASGGAVLQGWALAAQGQAKEGIAQMREGLAAVQATGARLLRPHVLSVLAEAQGQVGRTKEGLGLITEAMAMIDATGERFWEAELYRLRGELLQAEGSGEDQAEAWVQHAIKVAHRQHARSWELRSAVSLGRLWQQRGKTEKAHKVLAPVYGWFVEGFETADLKEARMLLEELER